MFFVHLHLGKELSDSKDVGAGRRVLEGLLAAYGQDGVLGKEAAQHAAVLAQGALEVLERFCLQRMPEADQELMTEAAAAAAVEACVVQLEQERHHGQEQGVWGLQAGWAGSCHAESPSGRELSTTDLPSAFERPPSPVLHLGALAQEPPTFAVIPAAADRARRLVRIVACRLAGRVPSSRADDTSRLSSRTSCLEAGRAARSRS